MILLCLAPGFEEIEALATVDILRRAGLQVTTVGIGGEYITGTHGITVRADVSDKEGIPQVENLQAVVLPGGMPGMTNLLQSETVDVLLHQASETGAYLCAVCASPSVLGVKGYLKGKRATCYPGFEDYLKGAVLCADSIVVDGRCITAKGAGVTLDFALAIVQSLTSGDLESKIRSEMQCR